MHNIRAVTAIAAFATLGGVIAAPTATALASGPAYPTILVAIRAAHHPGYDRLVFQFRGRLPLQRSVSYVPQVIGDPSGKVIPVVGNARLLVRFYSANGHTATGKPSYGPRWRTYALPEIIQVANAGDFEAVLRFGVGVAKREPFHVFTLANPSRFVIDISTPFRTTFVSDYFAAGKPPAARAAIRPVIPPAVAFGALQRLYAGPTQPELAAGLRFITSQTTGFTKVTISDRVARVYLTGGCNSGGSTFTVANEIIPTLKQFSSVRWVKIYSPYGRTQRPTGHSDSIPACLEP
jgi:hypothetical protein